MCEEKEMQKYSISISRLSTWITSEQMDNILCVFNVFMSMLRAGIIFLNGYFTLSVDLFECPLAIIGQRQIIYHSNALNRKRLKRRKFPVFLFC